MKPYYENENGKLYLGDCMEIMPQFEPKSIELILTDPPYGTTACKWDAVIPLGDMWTQLNRISSETTIKCVELVGSYP